MSIQKNYPLVSLIFPVKNEGENIRKTIDSAFGVRTEYPFEVVIVEDKSTDGCCDFISSHKEVERIMVIKANGIGSASARNLGAQKARGQYLIFCDAHVTFEDLWIEYLLEPIIGGLADITTPGIASMHKPNVTGYGQTLKKDFTVHWNTEKKSDPFATPIVCSCCIAMKKDTFQDLGGYDQGFKVWGYNDIEISLKAWLFGYKLFVQPKSKILHLFRKSHPYSVTYSDLYFNMLRTAYSHLNEDRIEKCKQIAKHADIARIEKEVLEGNILKQRKAYFARRKYDDDWFMNKFGIKF
ncbi:MAG TPA: glycosyltransferase [Bacillota bacterium]|nr:glycosyltransferase [Bacillota bacterium]